MVVANMDGPTRDQVLKLIDEKSKIENEISDLGAVLQRNHVGMEESLVDNAGFPRNDIDVYQVRHARHRIICLQNDHKALMKQIEKDLHRLHSGEGGTQTSNQSDVAGSSNVHSEVVNGQAADSAVASSITTLRVSDPEVIARVNFVSAGSPAEDSGIKVDDEILEFGSLNASNYKALSQIAEIVQHSMNTRINLKILRGPDHQTLNISLVPRVWAGRGLLGCNIIPIDHPDI